MGRWERSDRLPSRTKGARDREAPPTEAQIVQTSSRSITYAHPPNAGRLTGGGYLPDTSPDNSHFFKSDPGAPFRRVPHVARQKILRRQIGQARELPKRRARFVRDRSLE